MSTLARFRIATGSASLRVAATLTLVALWAATLTTRVCGQEAESPSVAPEPESIADAATSPSEGPSAATAADAPHPYLQTAESIAQLRAETLPLSVSPDALFDVSLTDGAAIALEAARLEALLQQAAPAPPDVSPAAWEARQRLDEARLAFYRLPLEDRNRLLEAHAARQANDVQARALRESSEALERAKNAEAERQRALAAAELAHSEAERLIVEERARLLGVASQIAERHANVARAHSALTEHSERTLALRRQVRDVVSDRVSSAAADTLYFELRAWLRSSRGELADALQAAAPEAVVVRDSDVLARLTLPIDRTDIDALYVDTTAAATSLLAAEAEYQRARSQQLYEEVQNLNDDRLALLPYLSGEQRQSIVGFGSVGLDQAMAELRQVALVISYHIKTVSEWVAQGTFPQWNGRAAGLATANLLQVLVILVAFFWGRRTLASMLSELRQRRRDAARKARKIATDRVDGAIGVTARVLEPSSWLLLLGAVVWVLPTEVTSLMEFELLEVTLRWTLGGWLAVVAIDQLAMRRAKRIGWRGHSPTDAIRLRSLRLLGIAVVLIGLTLALSERIVGAGTVYAWILSTSWWMALPIGLVIVHWWREVIFERIGHRQHRDAFTGWILMHRNGSAGLFAAAIGGTYLFAKGAIAITKAWLSGFELTRRMAAQLFRHQLDRMTDDGDKQSLLPLPAEMLAALSPSTPSATLIRSDDDPQVAAIIEHIDRTGGGVYAVVGERGSGRSTVLRRVSDSRDDVAFADCPFDGIDALTGALRASLALPSSTSLEEIGATLDAREADVGVVIDNAHRLIRPVMGGLSAFDQLVDVARRHSTRCAWVISMDRLVWRLLGRARPVSLLFDDVVELDDWSEEDIASLLRNRSRQAGIAPLFDRLVPALSSERDDYERRAALEYAETSYYRLIWDYAGGNPGVALHTWWTSLGLASDGRVYVTPFRTPEVATFDRLPDSAVFVLRAVLQLERARAEDVSKATLVSIQEVDNLLRFGVQQGFLHVEGGLHAVTWQWYGPITRFLQRRHLLAAG